MTNHASRDRRVDRVERRPHERSRRPAGRRNGADLSLASVADLVRITSPGEPLAPQIGQTFAPVVGHDLRSVRIHRDEVAAELAGAAGAEAFTIGEHIWFAAGRFSTTTPAGRRLLIHELTHIRVGRKPTGIDGAEVKSATDDEEHRSEHVADAFAHDMGAKPEPAAPRGEPVLARRASAAGAGPGGLLGWSPGDFIVGLVDRLLRRDPDDRGGRLRGVLARVAEPIREAVAAQAERGGGARRNQLASLLRDRSPADGGEPVAGEPDKADAPGAGQVESGTADPTGAPQADAGAAPGPETPTGSDTASADDGVAVGTDETAPKTARAGEEDTEEGPAPAELAGADAATDEGAAPADEATADVTAEPGTGDGAAAAVVLPAAGGAAAGNADGGPAADEEMADALAPSLPDDRETASQADDEEAVEPEASAANDDAAPAENATDGTGVEADRDEPPGQSETIPAESASELSASDAPAADTEAAEPAAPAEPTSNGDRPGTLEPDADLDEPEERTAERVEQVDEMESAEGTDVSDDASGEAGAAEGTTGQFRAPAPAPMEDAGGAAGGCGGGAGAAAPDSAEQAAAPAAGTDPAAAVGAVAGLKAMRRPPALLAAHTVATEQVTALNDELAAAPPSVERPSGVPASRDASIAPPTLPSPTNPVPPGAAELPNAGAATKTEPAAPPTHPASPTNAVRTPPLSAAAEMSESEVAAVRGAVSTLPTTDPALNVDSGPTPALTLDGPADPARVTTQATALVTSTTDLQAQASEHVVEDLGDRDIYSTVPAETLTAKIELAAPALGGGHASADTGKIPAVVIDRVADDEQGDAPRAKIEAEQAAMATGKSDQESQSDDARAGAKQELVAAVADNAEQQAGIRKGVASGADKARQSWVNQNAGSVDTSRAMATTATTKADNDVVAARTNADVQAQREIDSGNEKITKARTDAEKEAADKKAEAESESDDGGFFSWVKSKVSSFFNKIKGAIKAVFDFARDLVDKAIKAAQELAVAAIELGRKVAVAAIELAGDALILAGDVVLAGFPDAREKWRSTISAGVENGKQVVNDLADDLKAAAVAILDALGSALKGALNALEFVYTKALEAVEAVVQGVIDTAKAIADVFGDFLEIAIDVASGPLAWLKNLGSSVMDGVRNCTWPALKAAVKQWFREKVEAVIGVGKVIMDVLIKGCISFAQIAKMAWAAIKEALPGILIQILIEKLVAMLIPAAGALSLIIDGLRAAWGAASRILQAFKKFIAFLKAVKGGGAGAQFGALVGAAATAVLDFVANFVLVRMKGAGQKVGGVLRKMAAGITKALKKAAGAAKKVVTTAVKTVKRGAKAAAGAGSKAAGKVAAGAKKAAAAVGRTKVGRAVIGAAKTTMRSGKKLLDKGKKWNDKRKQRKAAKAKPKKPKETPAQKLARVAAKIRPRIEGWFDKGVGRTRLWAGLKSLRAFHRLRALTATSDGRGVKVVARVNPSATVGDADFPTDAELNAIVREVAEEIMQEAWVRSMGDPDDPGGKAFLGRARDEQFPSRDLPTGQRRTHRVGADGTAVTEQRGEGYDSRTRGNYLVEALGPYDRPSSTRPPVHQVLTDLGGGDDRVGAQRLSKFVRTGQVPAALQGQRENLAAAAHLLFTRESARNVANVAHSAMAADLVASGKSSFKEMVASPGRDSAQLAGLSRTEADRRRSGGELPSSMSSAQEAARGASPEQNEAQTRRRKPSKRQDTRELLRREAALTKKWLRATGWVLNHNAASQAQLKRMIASSIRDKLRERLRRFYGLDRPDRTGAA